MALALLVTASAGCSRLNRPAPVDRVAGRWPTLLGDVGRAGHVGELAPESVSIAWSSDAGRGLSAPLLTAGPLLVAGAADRRVASISARDGTVYWSRRLDGSVTGGIVRTEDRIFVSTEARAGKAYALDLREGRALWSRIIGSSPFAPAVVDSTVYWATEGGHLFALDAGTGAEQWRTRLPGAATSTPVPHRGSVLVSTSADTLFRIDRESGEIRDRAPLGAAVSAAPALMGDTLFIPLFNGELVALDVPSMQVLWRASFGAPILATPATAPDGSVYVLTRRAEVWRVPPGRRRGTRLADLGGAARRSLTLVRDRLLVGRLDGTLFLLRTDGSIVWSVELGDSIVAPVTVRNGAIYVPLLRGTIVTLR